jgi:hypothetical protein
MHLFARPQASLRAPVSEPVRHNGWRQGMMRGVKAQYRRIKAFSETDFTEDMVRLCTRECFESHFSLAPAFTC